MHSLVPRVLNVRAQVQTWVYWITTCTRSGAMQYGTDLQYLTIFAFTPDAERPRRTQDMDKAVCLSVARSKQIRDGPMQRRQRLDILLKDDLRRAA